ncbi:MAG: response regulator transcription factor [Syntrophaceae bacterium]|nr:response regulator transcription factor [Syntrophaceae bacterium]
MIKVVIAENYPIVRLGLKQVITGESDITVTGEAGTARDFFSLLQNVDCDVVILDTQLPDRNSFEVLSQLKRERPDLKVLVFSTQPEGEYAVRFFKVGVSGYMMKGSETEELADAIRKVHSGGAYVTPRLAEQLIHSHDVTDKPFHENLSNREFQIFCMIAEGNPLKKIANELCLSEKTISTYRSRILEKMMLKSNADLIRYALENNLI